MDTDPLEMSTRFAVAQESLFSVSEIGRLLVTFLGVLTDLDAACLAQSLRPLGFLMLWM